MYFSKIAILTAMAGTVNAQRPENISVCDYYTTALLKENTANNQATLLTLVVNTVVIGNYTEPNVGIKVPGILASGQYNGADVNLLPYFTGELASTNSGGDKGVSVNFLDDGGAEPLRNNKPANSENSSQYFLLTHLYQFFGSLLGCSQQGMPGFDAYTATPSMYNVHKFMDLDEAEVGYWSYIITQVGLAAASFGVADSDVKAVGTALNSLFGHRCAPPTTAIKAQGPQLQSICIASDCPLADNAVCNSYAPPVEPSSGSSPNATVSATSAPYPTGSPTTPVNSGTATTMPTSAPTAGAAINTNSFGLAAIVGGIAAFLL